MINSLRTKYLRFETITKTVYADLNTEKKLSSLMVR